MGLLPALEPHLVVKGAISQPHPYPPSRSTPHRLVDPYANGYVYLLGFASAAALHPAKVGHEMWMETSAAPGITEFNYDKPGRAELQIQLAIEQILPAWNSENPVSEFRNMTARFQALTGRDHTLLTRYERWLSMTFEDMGFGHQGTPRFVEIFLGHRLYIADGFSVDSKTRTPHGKKRVSARRGWAGEKHDFFSIRLASVAQLEHQYRPRQNQRNGIGQYDRLGQEDQSVEKPETDTGRKDRQHPQRYITRRLRGPGLLQLRLEGTGRQCPCCEPQ